MMIKDTSLSTSPQLAIDEQNGVAVALSQKQVLSLYKKSEQTGIPFDILKEVYERGYQLELTEQAGFNRVNSFIAGGAAVNMDTDLVEKVKKATGDLKNTCWKGYTAVGFKMKNGRRVPNCVPEEYTGTETVSKNSDDPSSRFVGTSKLTDVYKNATPGQSSTAKTIKKVVREHLEEATYQGKKVSLNKPMKGDVKKSKVYVDPDGDGKAQKVNFGDKNMTIKKNIPARRKSFRARHHCDTNPGPKTKARYWSCRAW
jgi:hypothetical protein